MAAKIATDGRGVVTFPLLSDQDRRTIDAYGLIDPAYQGKKFDGIPHPAIYVIDKKGRVAWAQVEEDYKKRPANKAIRAAIDELK